MPILSRTRSARLRLLQALFPVAFLMAACESDSSLLQPDDVEAGFSEETTEVDVAALGLPPGSGLRAVLDNEASVATVYELDALRIPAGLWDGYAQAAQGAFLQCLVAWGPREARLALSVGWNGRLFIQFSAPGWSEGLLQPGGEATIRVDESAATTVTLAASGDVLWASLGSGPSFADVVAEGEELVIESGTDKLVYPLERPDIAINSLYECLDRETGEESGDGAFAIYGLQLDDAGRARLVADVTLLLLQRGFEDFVEEPYPTTAETYGRHALLSGLAWGGSTRIFVTVFGSRPGDKKALAELVDDAARICRGEVAARLMRIDPAPDAGDSFGRSSLLCTGGEEEYAIETFAVFSRGEVLAIHAVVRDPTQRARVEQSFEAMKAPILASL